MNEPEQAQAITSNKDLYWCSECCGLVNAWHRCEQWCIPHHIPKEAVKVIRDSQAQKIAEQAKEIERLKQMVRDIDPEREP